MIKLSLAFALLASAAQAKPRLGVVVVVDQMKPDYLSRSSRAQGGFIRLLEEGMVFTAARHLHMPTETAPGHASISTGRHPVTHGIVANDWYDRAAATETYCVSDPVFGRSPANLQGPTLADALKASDPKARVFSVSSKDRAAVLLGGRKPDVVLWFDRFKGEYTTSSYYKRPSWLGAFNERLKKSALLPVKNGRVAKEAIAGVATDEATEMLVAELVAREGVGRGAGTDLLFVSYSGTDFVGHRHGLEVPEMNAQLSSLDAILGRLIKRLETASGGSMVLALSSDHGAIPAPEDASGRARGVRRLNWYEFAAALEQALQEQWPQPGAAWLLSTQVPHLYLNRALAAKTGQDWPEFKRRAARALSGVDGVSRVLSDDDAGGLPSSDPLAAVFRRSLRSTRSGDLQVVIAENTLLHDMAPGTSHGTPWEYDARVPLAFWGSGVRRGRVETPAATVDLAPTMARLLGISYPEGDGVVRLEALAGAGTEAR